MYIGRYYHTLEPKNRVSIPAKFRSTLQKGGVMTRGLDGCIVIYDQSSWDMQVATVGQLGQTKQAAREYLRFLTNDATELVIDAQGRTLLSEELRAQAGITKDVVIVGSLDRVEIWDRARYGEYMTKVRETIESSVETLDL